MTTPAPSLADALQDRYTLERELGRGGMATVYLAHDVRHDRLVALKVLHSQLVHAFGPERFLREVRTMAQLQHPHILPVFLPVFDLVELEVLGCGVKLDTVPYQRDVP